MFRNTDILDGRYQYQHWYVKLWRRVKYQWNLPLVAFSIWRRQKMIGLSDDHYQRMSWKNCWSIAIGLSQGKMEWYYTMEEVQGRLNDHHFVMRPKDDRISWFDKPDG